MKEPLIKLINEEIYSNVDAFENGAVSNGENQNIRSVKVNGLFEDDIGSSVSRRFIFNDLKKFTSSLEDSYRESVCSFYHSRDNYFQFLYYDSKMRGHYDYHTDYVKKHPRILTIIVGLNSVDEYEGGELFVQNHMKGVKLDKGDAIMFPSNFMYPHKVAPVTEGERKVLIIWTQ